MWRRQRCPWLLVCVTVCLLLDYPTYSRQQDGTAIYKEDYPNDPDCNTFATLGDYFKNEAGKNIICPYLLLESPTETESTAPGAGGTGPLPTSSTGLWPQCMHELGSLPANGSVAWCYTTPGKINQGPGTLCINSAGHRTMSYSENALQLVSHLDSITVLDDGRLRFPEVSAFFDGATIDNCTIFAEDGQICGEQRSKVNITLRRRTASTIADEKPSIHSAPKGDLEVNIGEQLRWCVSGGSLGVHDLQWAWSQNPSLETVNITANVSDPPCLNCECAQSAYYDLNIVQRYLHNTSVGGARGVAFSVLGYLDKNLQCSGVPTDFLSFVIIDGVRADDNLTELMFNVISFTGDSTPEDYAIRAFYKQLFPTFHKDYYTQDPVQTPQQNHIYFCNATIPGDANLEWRTDSNIPLPFISSSRITSRSNLSLTDVDNLCSSQSSNHGGTFSVRFKNSYSAYDSGAIYLSQEIALVLCSSNRHQSQPPTTYTCYSTSDHSISGPTASPLAPPSASYHVSAIVVPIIVIVLLLIAVLVIVLVIVYLRYSRLKAEAPRMCPIVNESATASLIAHTLGMETVDDSSNNLEFRRENLEFVKVLGEGQFGRVFKAIAEGICPYDNNRKVVAIKTLKENARPSDKDDLRSELATMRGMEPHPNILNYLGMCSETATEPLCILLEFAMYGSLKDYLKSVRTGKLPNPQLLLCQAPPIAPPPRTSTANHQVTNGNASTVTSGMTSSVYPATNSTLNLCPYHHNQLTQHRQNGTTPYLVPSAISTGGAPINQHHRHHHLCPAASVPLDDADPASKAHSMRLMRLLNSKYYTQQLTDDHEHCHGDTQESGQLVCSYCGVGETCVRRACLDDYPYWYHSRNDYYNSYYNYNSKQQKKGDSGSTFAKTSGNVLPPQLPPIYVSACEGEGGANSSGYPQQESVCHCESPPNLTPYVNTCSSYPQQESVCHCESPPNLNPYVNTDQGEGGANSSGYPQQEPLCHCDSPPNLNAYVNTYQGEGGANSSSYPQQELVCHCESPSNLNPCYNYNQSPSSGCIYCHHYANSEAGGGARQQPTGTDRANLGATLGRGGEGVGLNAAAASSDSTGTRLSYFEVLDFALQIARGMEHLDKMKCVHRDLAARNVLIAEGFLLKIGDFGLARDLSEKDYYRKITPGRVPARWMALESLEERTHTSKSDVWSYGVVLWEILTYGGLPYGKSPVASGIESLTAHIKAGHRLPKPPNCSEEMFGLLKMCWEEDPELRPSFTQLVNVFTTLLDSTEEYFSVSVEDAVHQRMTAHLEASAVAGISSSGPEREPLQPTILTSPYGTMGAPPVLSTSCSYIDEPDPPSLSPTGGHSASVPMSPGPSGASNLGPSLLDQVSTALGQDYLKLVDDSVNDHEEQDRSNELGLPLFNAGAASIGNGEPGTGMGLNYLKLVDDSANYHEERDHSNEGSLPLLSAGAANMGNREPGTRMGVNQTTTTSTRCSDIERTCDTSEERNEQVVHYPPPDIVLESLPSQSTGSLRPNGVAGASWDNHISGGGVNGRSKIKLGHSRTRKQNIHCLETEV